MKTVFIYLMAFAGLMASAQQKPAAPKPTFCPEVKADFKPAEFPGGADSLNAFFNRNFVLPKAYQGQKTKQFPLRVAKHLFITYNIETDGSLTDIKPPKGHDYPDDLTREAVRVLKLSPRWKPATMDGKPHRVKGTGYIAKIYYYKAP